ncbi:NAD(P)H-hydrate dehydratase [Stetteria hydrogenophila]
MDSCPGLRRWDGSGAVRVEDIRAWEVNGVWLGVPLLLLMENAGRAVADLVECKLGGVEGRRVVVYAGRGGNGGDALVAARHLAARGARVEVVLAYDPRLVEHGDARVNLEALLRSGYARVRVYRGGRPEPPSADAVVDGLLGVGVRGRLREPVATLAAEVNAAGGLKVAVDVPTGVDPDTGEAVEGAVVADATVTMHRAKRGLARASRHAGEVWVAEIGLPPAAEELAGPGDVAARIPAKPRDAHKGVGGRVLVVGGSRGYYGAPALAATAALTVGADLAFVAGPGGSAQAAASWNPNLIPRPLEGGELGPGHVDEVAALAGRAHAVVVGPGLGASGRVFEAVAGLLERLRGKPVVIDADALKAVAELGLKLWPEAVLTPHRGEARMLLDGDGSVEHVRAIAGEYNATVLRKGPEDVVCAPNGGCRVNRTGTPAMSVGGTGDVLAGVTAAFLARRASLAGDPDPLNAAAAAAWLTGRAGEIAAGSHGLLTATRLIESLPQAYIEALRLAGSA